MAQRQTVPDRDRAKEILHELWETVLDDDSLNASDAIRSLINHNQVSIRFCLPTQLLGKLTEPSLDVLSLQKGKGQPGQWDPRGFATQTIVPWNRKNQSVLGASGDPYVSNPLRRPRLDYGLDQMADREGWDSLCSVLNEIETTNAPAHTKNVLVEALAAIRDRLRELTFVYVLPDRLSLEQAAQLAENFLSERSGGDRGLAVAAAIFETIRERLGYYKEIRRGVVNAADAATKSAGDLECVDRNDRIIVAVEVKERPLGLDDIQSALTKARQAGVKELIFCAHGVVEKEAAPVEAAIAGAWASGTSIYCIAIGGFLRNILPLLGEQGIKSFVANVGKQLDQFNTQPRHRKAWKNLLDGL
jgi:hypothetical protein